MILVLGSDGLLGSTICSLHPKDTLGATRLNVDITDSFKLRQFIKRINPAVVINCAGIVRGRQTTTEEIYGVNAHAPRYIRDVCNEHDIRMIQVSTDCVFEGRRGNYVETDIPEATDHYGDSKWLGEIVSSPHLTVRSSFIGWPDYKGRGLMAWMMAHRGEELPGFSQVMWNGITAVALSSYLVEVAYNRKISGIRHVFGERLSKYGVLDKVNMVYGLGCTIIPTDEPVKDMTLATIFDDFPAIADWDSHLLSQLANMRDRFNGLTD